MSVDSENSFVLLSSRESRTSCIFQTADERDEIPGVGEESVLEMLSYSKFLDLETWLCMPSSLLLSRPLDFTHTSSSCSTLSSSHASNHSSNSPTMSSSSSVASISRRSICSEPGETLLRSLERDSSFLTPALGKEVAFLSTPLLPILSSTPAASSEMSSPPTTGDSTSSSCVSVRKRRRLAASPGGLHWNSEGSVQRDFWSPDPPSGLAAGGARGTGLSGRRLPLGQTDRVTPVWTAGERAALRKTLSADDQLLRPAGGEVKLLNRLERGRKKLRNIHSLGTPGRYDSRKK
ncbi:hypothetical protein XENORESO_005383 [Xenotaenia resolanae]|uniref:Uncharacterized protein n=1 Tax=Xenotaenia resolanae TaxID=208358 RepID=A0ABV0VN03_9TELE